MSYTPHPQSTSPSHPSAQPFPSWSLLHTGFTALIVLLDCSHPIPYTSHLLILALFSPGWRRSSAVALADMHTQQSLGNWGHTRGDDTYPATCMASGRALSTTCGLHIVQETVAVEESLLYNWEPPATCTDLFSSATGRKSWWKAGQGAPQSYQAEGRTHLQALHPQAQRGRCLGVTLPLQQSLHGLHMDLPLLRRHTENLSLSHFCK